MLVSNHWLILHIMLHSLFVKKQFDFSRSARCSATCILLAFLVIWSHHGGTQKGRFYDQREIVGEMGFLNLGQFSRCVSRSGSSSVCGGFRRRPQPPSLLWWCCLVPFDVGILSPDGRTWVWFKSKSQVLAAGWIDRAESLRGISEHAGYFIPSSERTHLDRFSQSYC